MTATIFPGSVFSAHANKLRSIRLEKLAQSIRRPHSVSLPVRPAAVAVAAKKPISRPGILSPLSGLRGRVR